MAMLVGVAGTSDHVMTEVRALILSIYNEASKLVGVDMKMSVFSLCIVLLNHLN